MWAVINTTPYAAEGTWIQDKHANKLWLVIVKATFDVLLDASLRLAEYQEPPLRQGQHVGDAGESSLAYEADLLGAKPSTDILVRGTAWVPAQRLATSIDVEFRVGHIRKSLRISGDRCWDTGLGGNLAITTPQPFDRMPIQYERAYGGWDRAGTDVTEHRMDARNPVGTGFCTSAEHCVGLRLPNVEYPRQLITSWKDRPQPAGLSPIECHWSPRRELAGTYDVRWREERFPLWAEDFDDRYNNCAPADQQAPGFLQGGETVDLLHLTPSGRLSFRLPRVYPIFETRFGRKQVDHRGELCTVVLEPDYPRVIMAWQTTLDCNNRVDELDATIVSEKRAI